MKDEVEYTEALQNRNMICQVDLAKSRQTHLVILYYINSLSVDLSGNVIYVFMIYINITI